MSVDERAPTPLAQGVVVPRVPPPMCATLPNAVCRPAATGTTVLRHTVFGACGHETPPEPLPEGVASSERCGTSLDCGMRAPPNYLVAVGIVKRTVVPRPASLSIQI